MLPATSSPVVAIHRPVCPKEEPVAATTVFVLQASLYTELQTRTRVGRSQNRVMVSAWDQRHTDKNIDWMVGTPRKEPRSQVLPTADLPFPKVRDHTPDPQRSLHPEPPADSLARSRRCDPAPNRRTRPCR